MCLFELILQCRKGRKESKLELIERFTPLIKKYESQLNYNEDYKQDLIVELIEIVNKIPINENQFKNDKFIISYISTSLKNKYIHLSKSKNKRLLTETSNIDLNLFNDDKFDLDSSLIVYDLLKSLNDTEFNVIKAKYINDLSDCEISKLNNISRQAVNQTKNRALKKLKNSLIN